MYKSSTQRIHLSRKCTYSQSFSDIPKHTVTLLHFSRVTHRDLFTCSFYMFNRSVHACNTFTVPTYHCATLPTTRTHRHLNPRYVSTRTRATPPTQCQSHPAHYSN